MAVPKRLIRRIKVLAQYLFIIGFFFVALVLLDSKFGVLPQAIHDHLPTHHDGLVMTDLAIQTCSRLNPFSTCRLDPSQWYRIDKDLYLGNQWTSQAFVHTRRKHEEELDEDDSVILDIRVSRQDPSKGEKGTRQGVWEARPYGVWILRSSKRHESDNDKAITAVDVLFGVDAAEPRLGWSMSPTPLMLDDGGSGTAAHITVRRGPSHKTERPVPRIRRDGKFKIVQLADLHLATGLGHCRDPEPAGVECEADQRTLDFVRRILDDELPDLVVLSGDQVNGDTAPDAQSAIFKIADVLSNRPAPIPYAAIFGNHDDEDTPLSRTAQMHIMESLPHSLSRAGPGDIDGVGNYYVEVMAPGSSHHSALTIYLLDTHSYSPDEKHYHGYDWIKENQIRWFTETAKSLKAKHESYAKVHMNMAFIHIPLPEYRIDSNHFVGEWREGVTAPYFNTHFKDALVEQGVLAVSCGHDHVNSYCMLSEDGQTKDPQLWMCYGGGAGFGGYGGYGGYHRRVRVFEIDTNEARIHTWKRMEHGDLAAKVDEQIIVSGGRVVDRSR